MDVGDGDEVYGVVIVCVWVFVCVCGIVVEGDCEVGCGVCDC